MIAVPKSVMVRIAVALERMAEALEVFRPGSPDVEEERLEEEYCKAVDFSEELEEEVRELAEESEEFVKVYGEFRRKRAGNTKGKEKESEEEEEEEEIEDVDEEEEEKIEEMDVDEEATDSS